MAQSRGSRQAPTAGSSADDAVAPSKPPPVPTLAPIRGIDGPRLDPGAVVCHTEEDLQRRGEVARRISDGVPDAGDPMVGCTMINQPRGVDILARHGLGRLQVRVKPSGQVGWTDAYIH